MRTEEKAHQLYAHITWCTEKRVPLIVPELDQLLKNSISDVCGELNVEVLAVETVPDHVHLLIRFHPTLQLAYLVKMIKGRTSRIITQKAEQPFQWQKGYGIDTVGPKSLEIAKEYVINQKAHHDITATTET
jgi:putative transposase